MLAGKIGGHLPRRRHEQLTAYTLLRFAFPIYYPGSGIIGLVDYHSIGQLGSTGAG